MFGPAPKPYSDHFQEWFTDREDETDQFRRLLVQATGAVTPIQSYIGVTGSGKTYLRRRLQEVCHAAGIKTIALELDPQKQGQPRPDRAILLWRMISEFGMSAPRSTHALLRLASEENQALNKAELARELSADVVGAAADSIIDSLQSFSVGSIVSSLAKTLIKAWQHNREPLTRFLKTPDGEADIAWFEAGPTPEDIRTDLFRRFALDLHHWPEPGREGRALKFALFIDSLQCAEGLHGNSNEREHALAWITELYRVCSTPDKSAQLAVATFGQEEVVWPDLPADFAANIRLEGFAQKDALEYIQTKRGIPETDAVPILNASRENDDRFHVLSLGLACDIHELERDRAAPLAEKESKDGKPLEEILIGRFLTAVGEADANRLRRLAVTPTWDDTAAAFALGVSNDKDEQAPKLAWLHRFSFVQATTGGQYTFHQRLRDSLLKTSSDEQRKEWHQEWIEHWLARSKDSSDRFAALVWLHGLASEPVKTFTDWKAKIKNARLRTDMVSHLWFIEVGLEFINAWLPDAQLSNKDTQVMWQTGWAWEATRTTMGQNRLSEAIKFYRISLNIIDRNNEPEMWASVQNSLGAALESLGERVNNLELFPQAIEACRRALDVHRRDTLPFQWAVTQGNLGNIFHALGRRTGAPELLQTSINSYRKALEVYDVETTPDEWASTQNNLGAVLLVLGERKENPEIITQATLAFENTLQVFNRETHSHEWAKTHTHLGIAWGSLGERFNDTSLLKKAIAEHMNALEVYDPITTPEAWAGTKNNLGIALEILGTRLNDLSVLQRAVISYEDALKVYQRETMPVDWALTQNNLGNVWRIIGQRVTSFEPFQKAVGAYMSALQVLKPETMPVDWATAQDSLGAALHGLGERQGDLDLLRKAVVAFHSALEVRKRQSMPGPWAITQNNLGIVLGDLGERTQNAELLTEAIALFHNSLEVRKLEIAPADWALTQMNLGIAYGALSKLTTDTQNIKKSIQAFQRALKALNAKSMPGQCKFAQTNLQFFKRLLAEKELSN